VSSDAGPLTPEEEAELRHDVAEAKAGRFRWRPGDEILRLLATLDAERSLHAACPRMHESPAYARSGCMHRDLAGNGAHVAGCPELAETR
jgi:hypothetical protein